MNLCPSPDLSKVFHSGTVWKELDDGTHALQHTCSVVDAANGDTKWSKLLCCTEEYSLALQYIAWHSGSSTFFFSTYEAVDPEWLALVGEVCAVTLDDSCLPDGSSEAQLGRLLAKAQWDSLWRASHLRVSPNGEWLMSSLQFCHESGLPARGIFP
ncbi:hypothetical protein WJX73_006024 [Symbiochloris irregularis]|uniref:Uncharacterized protein n=1 Tax=Symbiochloris irregularis TaxID=706552 RepID=A0AAW1NY00_9CHLO